MSLPREVEPPVSRLEIPAPRRAGLSENLEEVMNAESLELQANFKSDHLVGPCRLSDMSKLS